jgi:RNA-directed DNA polymerase
MSDLLTNLGLSLLLSPQELNKLIRSAPRRYKVYDIPKRNPNERRVIAQPAKEVKALQYWVMRKVLTKFPVHSAATAYRHGQSIADNALPHVHGRFLLKLDFRNFFPSIKARDFREFMNRQNSKLAEEDLEALSRILFWRPKGTRELCLSIGAPTSPILSNMILFDFDSRVTEFCTRLGVVYTRYADDLSFSADQSTKLQQAEEMVSQLCHGLSSPKLSINTKKTVRVSKKWSRRITGLIITNDAKVSLGREQKRRIRASVHHFVTGKLDKEQSLQLRGMLAYVNSVEPTFLVRLRAKFGDGVIRALQTITSQ